MAEKLHKYVLNGKEVHLILSALNHYLSAVRRNYRAGALNSDDYDYVVDSILPCRQDRNKVSP